MNRMALALAYTRSNLCGYKRHTPYNNSNQEIRTYNVINLFVFGHIEYAWPNPTSIFVLMLSLRIVSTSGR